MTNLIKCMLPQYRKPKQDEIQTCSQYLEKEIKLIDCKWFPVCPMKRFYEEGKLDKKWIELYCKGDWESCVRYHMEERGELHPDWMLPDGSIDKRLVNYIVR